MPAGRTAPAYTPSTPPPLTEEEAAALAAEQAAAYGSDYAPAPAPVAEPVAVPQTTMYQPSSPPPATAVASEQNTPAPDAGSPPAETASYVPASSSAGPVSQAADALGGFVGRYTPEPVHTALDAASRRVDVSGWAPPVATVADAALRGDLSGVGDALLDYANRPFAYASGRQGDYATSGQRQAPTPGQIAQDPSRVYDIVPGIWNTTGPGAWAAGQDIDEWAERNPQQAADAHARGGGQAVYEQWLANRGIQRTPAGVDSPIDDEQYSGSVLDRAGQAARELGQFGGSARDAAQRGDLQPYLRGMLADAGNDPLFAAYLAMSELTGGASLVGRFGRPAAQRALRTAGMAPTKGQR